MSKHHVEVVDHGTGFGAAGLLTTDHPTSSRDIPVFVGYDGSVYGPADLPSGCVMRVSLDSIKDGGAFRAVELREEIAALAERGGYKTSRIDGVLI